MLYFTEQLLNGIQLGMLLFLLAAGLTLIFGIMDLVNLAHGSLYMIGAYFAATFADWTDSFVLGAILALLATLVVGMVLEMTAIRRLYGRDHLDHVLATFGLLLFFNELVRLIWGPAGLTLSLPSEMLNAVQVLPGLYYPIYRLVIIGVTLAVGVALYVLVMRSRLGMLIRAGASNREMVGALGINIKLLYTLVFGRGAGGFRRLDAGADPDRPDRHGREYSHRRLRRRHHRRHRLDPRRLCCRHSGRHCRHDRAGFLARPAARVFERGRRFEPRPRAVVDVDLSRDGAGVGRAPGGPVSGGEPMSKSLTPRVAVNVLLVLLLALVPVYAALTGSTFAMTLFARIMIMALAALSLNLIMGYGGMVSFGHAAYLGIGGYAVGILAKEGITSGLVQWPAAIAASALYALVVGALSLRTRGVYFIMITLAFAQMIYYVAIGLDRYGGDDGLTIYRNSQFGGLIDIGNKTVFYYLCFALLMAGIYAVWRIVNSRFGLVIQGARSNERRMRAIGFPTFRYKLACFVIAGAMCGLAGALLANHTDYISPAMMSWTRSGDLIVMAVLGGTRAPFGSLIGAMTFLLLEDVLARATDYPNLIIGPLLLIVAIYVNGGIDGLLGGARRG